MSQKKPIPLPRFGQPNFYDRAPCPRCQTKIGEQDIRFAGAGRADDGSVCFSYQYQCPACQKVYAVLDRLRTFSRTDWWNELAAWHDSGSKAEQISADTHLARRDLPKIGPMVLGPWPLESVPWPLESVWIRGGYKGEVGPVIFHYEGEGRDASIGFIRLERDSRFTFLDFEDQFCLTLLELDRFANVPDGGVFPYDGRNWTKMSAKEIEGIIRDRVFEVSTDLDEPVTTPAVKRRRGHVSPHAKKSRKGTRRPPRNPRPLDS